MRKSAGHLHDQRVISGVTAVISADGGVDRSVLRIGAQSLVESGTCREPRVWNRESIRCQVDRRAVEGSVEKISPGIGKYTQVRWQVIDVDPVVVEFVGEEMLAYGGGITGFQQESFG